MRHFSCLLVCALFIFIFVIPSSGYTQGGTRNNPSPEVCEYVVSHVKKGELDKILIHSEPWDSTQIKVPELSGYNSAVVFKKLLDINNDGTLERVFVESQGTADYENFYAYELDKDHEITLKESWGDDWSDRVERWAADRAFIEFQGVMYILGKTDQSLQYLLYTTPNNEMKVVCEFGQREQPLQSLKTSQNDKVCKQALEDSIEYVEFNKLHSVSQNVVQEADFYETEPSEKAALVDINNDGKKEFIISLYLSSGRGRGCESAFLGVLTTDRSEIDKKFTEKLPSGRCGGAKVAPFVVDGKTYLDEREIGSHAGHMQVYLLDKDQLKTICEFEVRPDNYVISSLP